MGIRRKRHNETQTSLYDIEVRIARSRDFNFLQNLVVFNVYGHGTVLPIWHECDVLVCSKAGYLSEIEIKRSYADFLNDFKKAHDHQSDYIKNFYYCIPWIMKDKVTDFLSNIEDKEDWRAKAGIILFYDDVDWIDVVKAPKPNKACSKLTVEQQLYLARLGSMRVVGLKKKIAKMEHVLSVNPSTNQGQND